jgi:hypothetical protein
MKEADRLGMQLGMHICDGFALAGGPWITPEESMQKVVWSDTIVNGGNIRNLTLPMPEALDGYYEDIVTYAIPLERQPEDTSLKPKVTFGNLKSTLRELSRDLPPRQSRHRYAFPVAFPACRPLSYYE